MSQITLPRKRSNLMKEANEEFSGIDRLVKGFCCRGGLGVLR